MAAGTVIAVDGEVVVPETCGPCLKESLPEERRQHFLSMLAHNLQEAAASASRCGTPLGSSHPQDTSDPSPCDIQVGTAGPERLQGGISATCNASSTMPELDDATELAAEVPPVTGPDFFAGVDALKERMAQRKADSKRRSNSFVQAPPLVPGMPPPLPTGLSPRGKGKQCGVMRPPAAQALREQSTPSSCSSSPLSLPSSEQRRPRAHVTGEDVISRNQLRRPSQVHETQAPTREAANAAEDDEESLCQANGCGDELLQWAEEVLRMAHSELVREVPDSVDAGVPILHSGRRPPPVRTTTPQPVRPRQEAGHPTPRAGARQRRAEELREKMKRLMAESECECERLSAEEEARQLRADAERMSWQDRLNSAAEEMRSNFTQWSFDTSKASQTKSFIAGTDSQTSQRGGSMPPPRLPRAPPTFHGATGLGTEANRSVPPAPHRRDNASAEHEAAWAQLEAQLESGSGPIHFTDIPWPDGRASSITGMVPGEVDPTAKRRLAVALRRWHPDKWRRIIDRVPEAEQQQVMERVKSIAQRLLEEKARFAGLVGVLH